MAHSKLIPCTICPDLVSSDYKDEHDYSHLQLNFQCNICQRFGQPEVGYMTLTRLKDHFDQEHEDIRFAEAGELVKFPEDLRSLECGQCSRMFYSQGTRHIQLHLQFDDHFTAGEIGDSIIFKCRVCNFVTKDESSWSKHFSDNFSKCKREIKSEGELLDSFSSSSPEVVEQEVVPAMTSASSWAGKNNKDESFSCGICSNGTSSNLIFRNARLFDEHLQSTLHRTTLLGAKKIECQICNLNFPNLSLLNVHFTSRAHKEKVVKSDEVAGKSGTAATSIAKGNNVVINLPGVMPGTPGSQITVPLQTLQKLQPGQGIPTGQAGHLLVKTENGQYQILRVGSSTAPGSMSAAAAPVYTMTSVPPSTLHIHSSLVSTTGAHAMQTQRLPLPPVGTSSQNQPLTKAPATSSFASSSGSGTAASAGNRAGMGQQMTPDTAKLKCKNFLETLLRLGSEQPVSIANNVHGLIQGLIDGIVEPEVFTTRLQQELNSSPQPCLVPFLKKSIPHLQQSLRTGELTIEGVSAPMSIQPSHLASSVRIQQPVTTVIHRPPQMTGVPPRVKPKMQHQAPLPGLPTLAISAMPLVQPPATSTTSQTPQSLISMRPAPHVIPNMMTSSTSHIPSSLSYIPSFSSTTTPKILELAATMNNEKHRYRKRSPASSSSTMSGSHVSNTLDIGSAENLEQHQTGKRQRRNTISSTTKSAEGDHKNEGGSEKLFCEACKVNRDDFLSFQRHLETDVHLSNAARRIDSKLRVNCFVCLGEANEELFHFEDMDVYESHIKSYDHLKKLSSKIDDESNNNNKDCRNDNHQSFILPPPPPLIHCHFCDNFIGQDREERLGHLCEQHRSHLFECGKCRRVMNVKLNKILTHLRVDGCSTDKIFLSKDFAYYICPLCQKKVCECLKVHFEKYHFDSEHGGQSIELCVKCRICERDFADENRFTSHPCYVILKQKRSVRIKQLQEVLDLSLHSGSKRPAGDIDH